MNRTHYAVLGVHRTASEQEIRKSYLKLSRSLHPDKRPESEREVATKDFMQLNESFSVLSDSMKRREYDLTLAFVAIEEEMRVVVAPRPHAVVEKRHDGTVVVVRWENVRGVREYVLEMRLKGDTSWKLCYKGTKKKVAVGGLPLGRTYEFRVCGDEGPWSHVVVVEVEDSLVESVAHLQRMGFTEKESREALERHGGDVEKAVGELLRVMKGGGGEVRLDGVQKKSPKKTKEKKKKTKKKKKKSVAKKEGGDVDGGGGDGDVVDEELDVTRVKCSRCKERVLVEQVDGHVCDPARVLSVFVCDPDLDKMKSLLAKAGGEINAAIALYFGE